MWILDTLIILVGMIPAGISVLMGVSAMSDENDNRDNGNLDIVASFLMFVFACFLIGFLRSCLKGNASVLHAICGSLSLIFSIVCWKNK